MRCDEVQPLQSAYLDSELDTRTALEIEQHLRSCPECARCFADEERRETRLRASLNRGQASATLWAQIESSVIAAASPTRRPQPSGRHTEPTGLPGWLLAFGEQLQAGWRRSRWVWSGLAAAWVVIFALNFTAPESELTPTAQRPLPAASEVRLAVKQKHLLMVELALSSESAPADKPKPAPPGPRSDRRKETLNA